MARDVTKYLLLAVAVGVLLIVPAVAFLGLEGYLTAGFRTSCRGLVGQPEARVVKDLGKPEWNWSQAEFKCPVPPCHGPPEGGRVYKYSKGNDSSFYLYFDRDGRLVAFDQFGS